ncbi:MAG: hypothetical protein MJ160_02175 [Treponema sp.]|nr:hypothetical protein [Treponema sp.]
MKKYKDFVVYNFSDYAEEITGDALFKINGGAEVENSHEGVANAQVGDTITRNDGTVVTLNQADIDYAQQQLGTYGNQETNNTSPGSQNYSGGSNQTTSETKEPIIQKKNDWTFNPNEPDSDKRYNAKDINGLHVMTISCDDKENFLDYLSYYTLIGQYGSAGTIVYDGIGLTDKNGNIIHILTNEETMKNYARSLGIQIADGLHGDIFITAEVDLVAGWGFEGSISLVIDLDNWKDSGINISGGFAGGCNVGVGVGVGYVKRELEGCSPIGCDGNFGYLPFSAAVMTDEEGFNGGSITFGPGMGVSSSVQNSYTLSINTISKLIK